MIPREYLRKIRRLEIRTSRLAQELLAGAYHSAFKGRGMDFEEVRAYEPGDDVRTIDWNVSARTSVTHVKKFREERELSIAIVVDVSASGIIGSGIQSKREFAAEIASVLAFSASRNGDRVGLILYTSEVEHFLPARKGRSHIFRLIHEILYFAPRHRGTSCERALGFLNHLFPRRAIVFLISDFLDEGYEKILRVAGRRHDLIAIPVSDPIESALPRAGWITLEDAETGELVEINTSDPRVRAEYENASRERERSRSRMLRGAGIDAIPVQTGEPYKNVLRQFFERRMARRRR